MRDALFIHYFIEDFTITDNLHNFIRKEKST